MLGNRRSDTAPELSVRRLVHRSGLRYRVDYQPTPDLRRKADLVFTKARVAVFIDGCYWHGCPEHFSMPKTNRSYWMTKIEGNRRRDADTDQRLRSADWTVLRFWEHDDPAAVAARIIEVVRNES